MLRVLVLSLGLPLASAHAEDAKPAVVENRGSSYRLTELATSVFAVRDGGFGEIGLCSARRPGTVSSYACMSLDLGKQDGAGIASEVTEWGLRVQPTPWLAVNGAVGFSLLTALVDALACAAKKSGPAGADGPSEMPGGSDACGAWLPLQFYPGISTNLTIPVSGIDLVVTGSARYVVPIPGSVGVAAPSGVAVALGAGVAF